MKADFRDRVDRIDRLIRAGQGEPARAALEALLKTKVPREAAASVGRLLWRMGLADKGLRLLNPIVRPTGRRVGEASPAERAEYAVCLVKAGATPEAWALLETIDAAPAPRTHLYRAFALFSEWEYERSLPHLLAYLRTPLTQYDRVVARINLATACVYERHHHKAEYLLRDLLHEASVKRWDFALGRVLELSAENFIGRLRFAEAEPFLRRAEERLKESASLELLYIRKFRAIGAALGKRRDLGPLRETREAAIGIGHWETVRDCDRFLAIATKDDDLFRHLYFGTEYPSFREKIVRDYAPGLELPAMYEWHLGGAGGPRLDLATGLVDGKDRGLAVGQAMHRLLATLASDFYRPFRTAALFGRLYPGEYFNPVSAPLRVRQVVKRVRQWFGASGLPLGIDEEKGSYRLIAQGPCTLGVAGSAVTRDSAAIETLRGRWPDSPFSKAEAGKVLDMSSRSALRLLERAIADGILTREGRSNATRYAFSKRT